MDGKNALAEPGKLKVAVVGGGMAGLAAAVSLMDKAEVTVFEKSKVLGGRAATAHKEGYDINQGPHALYRGGFAYKFLAELDLLPPGASPNLGGGKAYYKNKLATLPVTPSSLLSTNMLSLGEKWQLANFFKRLPGLDTAALKDKTINHWLESQVRSPAVRAVVAAFIRLSSYCNNPANMSAAAAVTQLNLSGKGVLYLDHGWETMVKALANKAAGKVTIMLGAEIKELQERGADIEIQICGTDENQAENKLYDAVILAIPPLAVAQLFERDQTDERFTDVLKQIKALEATRAACLDLCLKQLPVGSTTFALGIDEPLYFSVHSKAGKLAPPGGALVHAAYYLEAGKNGGIEHRNRLEKYLDQLQPGWREQVVYERFMPNMVASYGCALAANKAHQGVDGPLLKGAKNIYVCGDWVGSGHMLVDAAVSSASAAAALISAKNVNRPTQANQPHMEGVK